MAPRKRCLICGSRKWRKNAVGLVTCNEGHVLQHYINESEEVDDVGTHMMRKRALKSNRKTKERASRADPKLYHGDRARFHYYQCLQLLFRKQVAVLIKLWNLPPEFEAVCRDLWVFHLNLIPNPPPAEPFHYARDQDGYQCEPEENRMGDGNWPRCKNARHPESMDSTDVVPCGNSSSIQEEMLAPEIAVLMEENSEVSSSDDGSCKDGPPVRNNTHTSSENVFASRADRPENTIAVIVIACWVIRLPVVYTDFINAIESYSLPYLDHIRTFPLSLTRHLTKHAVQALSPHYAPRALTLHRLASRLASRLYDTFDVVVPEPNVPPILWRVVRECFCGTPTLYILTKTVGNVLSLGLSPYSSSTTLLPSTRREDSDRQRYDNAPPEVSLIAIVIVVLKLVYGLDGKERLPRSTDDAACAFPDVAEFLAAVNGADHAGCCDSSHRFGSRVPVSVGDLDDVGLDEYLNFCQKVLVDPNKDEHRIVDDYFPLGSLPANVKRDEPHHPRGRGLPSTERNDGDMDILEPGEMYTIYDAKDVLGNLSEDLKAIVEKSARWAGVDTDFMCGVIERYERRLVRWWYRR